TLVASEIYEWINSKKKYFDSTNKHGNGYEYVTHGSNVAVLKLIINVSSNYYTDKKPAAVNWIEGR
ncbi:15543_t:CDS:2, partial [Racocetra persica]